MTQEKQPSLWGMATAADISAVLKEIRVALSAQNPSLLYTAGLNLPVTGDREINGLGEADLYPGADADLTAFKSRVIANGKGESLDLQLKNGEKANWYRVWVQPLSYNGDGSGVLSAVVDISGQKAVEEHLRLALLELAHRSKNLLAIVLSIARQTADDSYSMEAFRERFVGRIRSLALAHDVLTDESWRGATVFSLVRSQLTAFSESANAQSTIEGHNAYLKPNAVQYVGLALHELIAMSMLNGALSQPDGRLEISSALARERAGVEGQDLVLTWRETGLRAPYAPEDSRFGRALLEQIVPAALGGQAAADYERPREFSYWLKIPRSQFF